MSEQPTILRFHTFYDDNLKTIIEHIGIPRVSIEIGVFDGYSAFSTTFLCAQTYKDYKHYAIDPYEGASDLLTAERIALAEKNFVNIHKNFVYKDNIEFIKKRSWDAMVDLYNAGVKADFIYVDGDHKSSTVLDDMVLAFKLLKVGGIMLCDDATTWQYRLENAAVPIDYTPKLAIDSFMQCNWGLIEPLVLSSNYQVAFKKTTERLVIHK